MPSHAFVHKVTITLYVEGKDSSEAESHVDSLLDAGVIQAELDERAGSHGHDITITNAECASEPYESDDEDDEAGEPEVVFYGRFKGTDGQWHPIEGAEGWSEADVWALVSSWQGATRASGEPECAVCVDRK
jgi:hypothetical protein